MPVTVDLSAAVVTVVVVAVGGPLQWNTLGGVDDSGRPPQSVAPRAQTTAAAGWAIRRCRRCMADVCDGRLVSGCGGGGGGSSRRPLQWNTQRHAVATYWPFRRLQQSTGEVNARGALRLPRRRRIRCLPLNNL
jgi:hypothetical protein